MLNEKYSKNSSPNLHPIQGDPTPGIHVDVHPAPPDSLSLTIQDLENGPSPDQLAWLLANLNVRALIRALAKIAPADEVEAPPEGEADGR